MSENAPHAEWAKTLAEQLVTSGATPPDDIDDQQRLALAWALKDYAVAAWGSAPGEVEAVARIAGRLHQGNSSGTDHSIELREEVKALSAWIDAITALIRAEITSAVDCIDRAADIFGSLKRSDQATQVQIPKIIALALLGRHREALDLGLRIKGALLETGDSHAAARVSLNLANLHDQLGNYAAALDSYKEARAIFEQHDDAERVVAAGAGLADVYASLGEHDLALTEYRLAAGVAEKHGFDASAAIVLESIAAIHAARGEYRGALALQKEAIDRYKALGMLQALAVAERQMGAIYLEIRLYEEALRLFDAAADSFRAASMQVEAAWNEIDRAKTLHELRRDRKEIANALARASRLFTDEKIGNGLASVALLRAEHFLAEGDFELAKQYANHAISNHTERPNHPQRLRAEILDAYAEIELHQLSSAKEKLEVVLHKARKASLRHVEVSCEIGLGLCSSRNGDQLEAERWFESSVEGSEALRRALPSDDLRRAFLADHLLPYKELLRMSLDTANNDATQRSTTRIFRQLERIRARTLSDRLEENFSQGDVDVGQAALRARLQLLYRRSQRLNEEGENSIKLDQQAQHIEFELLEQTRRESFTRSANPLSAAIVDIDSLQKKIGLGGALVEYGVVDDELFACVLRGDRIDVVRHMASWSKTKQLVAELRFQIDTMRYGAQNISQHSDRMFKQFENVTKQVSDAIWLPISSSLRDCERVAVVPHSVLGQIPFSALSEHDKSLGEKYALTVLPNAQFASIRDIQSDLNAPCSVVAVGEGGSLQHADKEAIEIAELFPRRKLLLAADASGSTMRSVCHDADVLHIACHASFRADNPTFSSLQLVDGSLAARDAESLSLNASMVTLSGCETGGLESSHGDEMLGLVRGFLIGGANRVLASLWVVDDAITRQWMSVFYRSLRSGSGASQAVRAAQGAIRSQFPHPFYWAAFALFGGW